LWLLSGKPPYFEHDNFGVSEITVFSLKICDHDLAMIVIPTKMVQFNLMK